MRKFTNILEHKEIDPYNEENWDDDKPSITKDLWLIYVLGQDENFLSQKQLLPNPRYPQWPDYEYKILCQNVGVEGMYSFDNFYTVSSNNAYPVEDLEKILIGERLVGYIIGFGTVRYDTLQNLCNGLGVTIENINFKR